MKAKLRQEPLLSSLLTWKTVEDGTFCFKFSSLRQEYENRLHILGISKEINKVRFKERVLEYFPNAQEQNDGKDVILIFEQGMQQMLMRSVECDYQEDVLISKKAAKIVHDIFSSNRFNFNASFPHRCQQESVPTTLKPCYSEELTFWTRTTDSQACLSVSQAILFN